VASLGDLGRERDPALSLPAVLEDLEQQAVGLALEERDDAVRDLAEAAYAEVALSARLHAAVRLPIRLRLAGGWRVDGQLDRIGSDFVVITPPRGQQWLVRTASVRAVEGLLPRARPADALPVTARLGFTSVLRRLTGTECTMYDVDGVAFPARPGRVGADFVELEAASQPVGPSAGEAVVPLTAIAAVRSRR
jgi:hypothetical protein